MEVFQVVKAQSDLFVVIVDPKKVEIKPFKGKPDPTSFCSFGTNQSFLGIKLGLDMYKLEDYTILAPYERSRPCLCFDKQFNPSIFSLSHTSSSFNLSNYHIIQQSGPTLIKYGQPLLSTNFLKEGFKISLEDIYPSVNIGITKSGNLVIAYNSFLNIAELQELMGRYCNNVIQLASYNGSYFHFSHPKYTPNKKSIYSKEIGNKCKLGLQIKLL